MTTRAADIIFIERDPVWENGQMLGRWDVALQGTQDVQGTILGRKVSDRVRGYILTIREVPNAVQWAGKPLTHYEWRTPGETHPGGNRNHLANDWAGLQKRVLAWAGRRFRIEVES